MEALKPLGAGDPREVGPYRLVARLGAGGMGRVYLGRSRGGRAVAVKVVRPELAEDHEFRQRFAREVTAARRVNGVFTAGVVDADPDADPPWLATAYVPGMSLDVAVARSGAWPEGPVTSLAAGLAEALEAIHAAGLVHRDLKPSNVLLASDGPRVIDFGISVASEVSAITRTGAVIGTPGFMSPEQLTGGRVGPASDVFALGAVLAFTASGTGPFGTGSAQGLMFRIVYSEPDLAAVPPGLRPLVARCLAKDPADRPAIGDVLSEMTDGAGAAKTTLLFTSASWLPDTIAGTVREYAQTVADAAGAGAGGRDDPRSQQSDAVTRTAPGGRTPSPPPVPPSSPTPPPRCRRRRYQRRRLHQCLHHIRHRHRHRGRRPVRRTRDPLVHRVPPSTPRGGDWPSRPPPQWCSSASSRGRRRPSSGRGTPRGAAAERPPPPPLPARPRPPRTSPPRPGP